MRSLDPTFPEGRGNNFKLSINLKIVRNEKLFLWTGLEKIPLSTKTTFEIT
jgi:hypothetical protein